MRVTIFTSDRGRVRIERMPDDDAAALVEDFTSGDSPTMTVTLDDEAACHVARAHVVRVDVEPEAEDRGKVDP